MDYSVLVETYEKLESVSSKLKKTDILAQLFSKVAPKDLPKVVSLAQGLVFPWHSEFELGIATQMMLKAIAKASGFSQEKVGEKFKKTGDLGLTAQESV